MIDDRNNRWAVDELEQLHGDEIRRRNANGESLRAIARNIWDITGRYVSRYAVRTVVNTDVPPMLSSVPKDVSSVAEGDAEEPLESLLARRMAETRRSVRRQQGRMKACRMPLEPFGLAIFGDPHLDDPGCRWDLLRRDIEAAKAPGVLSISVGDHQNHWIGRLAKIYASQGTTASEGWRLAKWFLGSGDDSAGLDWLIVVGGNHDAWSHATGFDPYHDLCRGSVRYYDDAEVRLRLVFDHETEPLVLLVRHDFPGRSWFHASHGPAKAAMLDHEADILAAGHLHSWACLQQEVSGGRCPVAIRARGYKTADHFARERGFLEQQYGHGCMLVVDPSKAGSGRVTVFWDMQAGADYLQTIRK